MDDNITISEEIQYRESIVEKYIENCKKYQITVDPAVVISLLSGWKRLQPSNRFGQGEMVRYRLFVMLSPQSLKKSINR